MPPVGWGSKWLEGESDRHAERAHDEATSRSSAASTSGRRWMNVVQGIRRSLDVHLKSYYKVDSAFAAAVKSTSASDKLRSLARGLADTGLVDFCCIYLVHAPRGTFGAVAISGAGAELYPPVLSAERARAGLSGSSPSVNVFTRNVFQVQDSNWAVEDVVSSKAPWYYDCAAAANGFGLPQEAAWLRRVGMRSVLALPCMVGGDVVAVLTVATKQKSLDHLLLRKLEELCYRITPLAVDAVGEQHCLLNNRRLATPYESYTDFAHAVLGEMLNLDRAVASAVAVDTVAAPPAPAAHQQHLEAASAPASARPTTRGVASKPADLAAAVAAAAAAGFSWTCPTPHPSVAASPSLSTTGTTCAAQQPAAQTLPPTQSFASAHSGAADNRASNVLSSMPFSNGTGFNSTADLKATMVSEALARLALEPAAEQRPTVSGYAPQPCSQSAQCTSAHAAASQQIEQLLAAAKCQGSASPAKRPTRSTRSLSCLEFSSGDAADADSCGLAADSNGPSPRALHAHAASAATRVRAMRCGEDRVQPAAAAAQKPIWRAANVSTARHGALASASPPPSGGSFMLETGNTDDMAMPASYMMARDSSLGSQAMHRAAPLEPSVGVAAVGGANAHAAALAMAALAAMRGSTASTHEAALIDAGGRGSTCATSVCAPTTTLYGGLSSHRGSTVAATHTATGGLSELLLSPYFAAESQNAALAAQEGCSRWSRDSAAAAAAMWGSEATEAFEAAVRFTGARAFAAAPCVPPRGRVATAVSATAAEPGFGARCGLSGIRESEPLSLNLEQVDDDAHDDDLEVAVFGFCDGPQAPAAWQQPHSGVSKLGELRLGVDVQQ